jgi:acetyl esterase/lipase
MKKYGLFLLLAFTGLLPAQKAPAPFELPAGVEMKKDVVYATYGSREVHLDLYLPKDGKGPFPAVVYIHGGGWVNGGKNAFERQAAYMATKGFVGACIEYRLSGEAKFPAAIYDSKAAVRWLRANAAKYQVNPNKIGAAGGSAGGHLVALLGTSWKVKELEGAGGNAGVSSRVQAVAAFNPVTDFVSIGKATGAGAGKAVSDFLGANYAQNPGRWAEASPMTYVDADSAPTLFLHGDADTTVPYRQSVDMRDKLKAAGVYTDLFTGKGAKHAFFNNPPFYEPTLKKMEEFFTKTLK